jgi:hypothetical protein
MSDHDAHAHDGAEAHGHAHDTTATQAENLPIGKVITVGLVSLFVFAVGSVWALKIRTATIEAMNPSGAIGLPANFGAEEQGIVDQIPFELNHWVKDDRAASKKQLHGYGWVDRQAGTIHIPIERAIELQLAEQKK